MAAGSRWSSASSFSSCCPPGSEGARSCSSACDPGAIPLQPFIKSITEHPPVRVPGTAVFLTASQEGVPHAMLHNLNHNKVLHERVVLLTVRSEDIPHVRDEQRVDVEPLGHDFYRVTVHYGFKDEPDLPDALAAAASSRGLEFNMMETSFFLVSPDPGADARDPAWRCGARSCSPRCRATPPAQRCSSRSRPTGWSSSARVSSCRGD